MNHNNIYFIQIKKASGQRQCFIVSSPSEDRAQACILEEGWADKEKDIVISSEQVEDMVDIFDAYDGKDRIVMHN